MMPQTNLAAAPQRANGIAAAPRIGVTVGAVSRLFGLTARAIRFYEEEGLIRPTRDALNRRRFGPADRTRLQVISMLRAAKLRLEDIRTVLDASSDDATDRALTLLQAKARDLESELANVRAMLEGVAQRRAL